MLQRPRRLHSIDVFRAITMFFMIFVNDVDGVHNIPVWIKHVSASADGLGFADTIFPSFLFIVGLSIPIAIGKRIQLNESTQQIAWYILLRSFALIVMGFFHVNIENYSDAAMLPRSVFEILATIAFFLIWLNYKPGFNKTRQHILQAAGIAILIILACIFKGEKNDVIVGMRIYWWGILGLIGWAYLTCSLIYLFSKGRLFILVIALLLFLTYTTLNQTEIFDSASDYLKYVWLLNGGSEVSFVMSGIIISILYTKSIEYNKNNFFLVCLLASIAMFAFGFLIRPIGGISKIHGTPAWVGICVGISVMVFVLLIYLTDIKGKSSWFNIIKPAGTATLTCYLIPYILYPLMDIVNFKYPHVLNEGIGGIIRSFAVSFIVIFIAGFLQKKNMCLKI